MMDYEKKYNEALERFKSFKEKYYIKDTNLGDVIFDKTSEMQKDFNNIFPELREEEKPLTPFQQCLNLILHKVYYASVPGSIVEDVDKFVLGIVKNHTDELVALAKKHEYTDCQLRESKEEKIRKYLIDELKAAKSVGELKFIIPQPTREECIAYLEKQKEQKPAWSEEDEEIRDNIICILQKDVTYTPPTRPNSCTGSGNAFYTHQTEIDWLKSLRPSWKPSEEQIEAVKCAALDVKRYSSKSVQLELENEPYYGALISLYNDLKKL